MNCAACEKPLVRKVGEDPSRFRKRKCCNNACRIIALRDICNKLDAAKRVLMTALGWDDFEELMEYLRDVPWANVGDQRVKDLRGAA